VNMSKWIFLCLLFASSLSNLFANEGMIVRFDLNDSVKEYLRLQEFDITGINFEEKHIEAFLTEEQLEQMKSKKINIFFSKTFNGFTRRGV
jgi:hypothetical protein